MDTGKFLRGVKDRIRNPGTYLSGKGLAHGSYGIPVGSDHPSARKFSLLGAVNAQASKRMGDNFDLALMERGDALFCIAAIDLGDGGHFEYSPFEYMGRSLSSMYEDLEMKHEDAMELLNKAIDLAEGDRNDFLTPNWRKGEYDD